MKKIYIAGKISGIEKIAEIRFKAAENSLKIQGFDPVNPFSLYKDHNKSWEAYMKEGIKALMDCDVIYLLRGWEDSPGAGLEWTLANEVGIDIMFEK